MGGWPADDLSRLAVVPTEVVGLWPLQPTAGRFEVVDGEIRFRPRFPLARGTGYSLLLDGVQLAAVTLPVQTTAGGTSVVAIYPTARELPLNHLKFYIQFSWPMSEGWADRAVRVRRADDGQSLPGIFLPMQPELWDYTRRRLTLLLDPGRIKRGLAPNQELGYPLQERVPIVVAVDRSFRDASGLPLVAGMERRYEVVPAVRQHIRPSAWRLRRPAAGSTDAVAVAFDRPLDRALLEHSLVVLDPHGSALDGQATIAEGERSWRFRPLRRWRPEPYCLAVDSRLEDLAGNSLTRVFDRHLTRPEDTPVDIERALIEFYPRQGR